MTSTRWIDQGLLFIRVALAIVFIMHGGQKFFLMGLPAVTAGMAQIGLPFPSVSAFLTSAAELGGGVALLFGLFTRLAALILAFDMSVAVLAVHITKGFFLPAGFEFALTLLLVNLGIALTGPGRYSIDAWLSRPVASTSTSTPTGQRHHAA